MLGGYGVVQLSLSLFSSRLSQCSIPFKKFHPVIQFLPGCPTTIASYSFVENRLDQRSVDNIFRRCSSLILLNFRVRVLYVSSVSRKFAPPPEILESRPVYIQSKWALISLANLPKLSGSSFAFRIKFVQNAELSRRARRRRILCRV